MPPLQAGDPDKNLPWLPLGRGDLISVIVSDCPELSRAFRIADDGSISMPLLEGKMYVAGKRPPEVEQLIAEAAKNQHLLVRPSVAVAVIEYRSRPVSVVGAVNHPLIFQAIGEITLLDALARAEGLNAAAGPEIVVTSQQGRGADSGMPVKIRVRQLLAGKDPSLNLVLKGGEEIRVPEAEKVYVVGNVKMPGAIPVHDDVSTTVLRVLAQCQGLTPFSTKDAVVYRLKPGSTEREEISIHLSLIIKRKAPDAALLPNDVFYVPDATGKRVSLTALGKLGDLGGSTLSGMAVWSRF
ncbi:MAG: polysaccharide biosynthesis/export family protein [Acidobacteriota bacterium]|nr:polysaccharide biosynthesis/export family protein [Acidobacteriota bacterium]